MDPLQQHDAVFLADFLLAECKAKSEQSTGASGSVTSVRVEEEEEDEEGNPLPKRRRRRSKRTRGSSTVTSESMDPSSCAPSTSGQQTGTFQDIGSLSQEVQDLLGPTENPVPSHWKDRKASSLEKWTVLSSEEPEEGTCQHCRSKVAIVKCQDCLPRPLHCTACDVARHESMELHNRSSMVEGFYRPLPPTTHIKEEEDGKCWLGGEDFQTPRGRVHTSGEEASLLRAQDKLFKMPRGSTTTHCINCKAVIPVATKTCKSCQAIQPRKIRLAKKLNKFEAKKEDWLKNLNKNKTTSHVMDEVSVMLEKLKTLGHRAVVFIAKPVKKPGAWKIQVVHPEWQLTDQASACLDRMKALYEVVVPGWTYPQLSTASAIDPSTSASTQLSTASTIEASNTPAIQLSTVSVIDPSTSSATQSSTTTANVKGLPPKKKGKQNKEDSPGECSHNLGENDEYYPVKQVVKTKMQKGKQMLLVEWEPCTMCGKTWPLQWVTN